MWAIVIFDLPVITKADRKEASKFRKDLLDKGFQMVQLSVYFKLLSGVEELETIERYIESILPRKGKVEIIHITDRQYEDIKSFYGNVRESPKKSYTQLQLF
ncbi:MAG: CRISPR-associated endonuclease Cas2 [Spirochaetaceae bacterium]|nr:CRISPR-associated endonuclease Cas2 [Spirochaetaceae bacterium]